MNSEMTNEEMMDEMHRLQAENEKLKIQIKEYKYCSMTNLKGRLDFNRRLDELWHEYVYFSRDFMLGIVDLNGLHAINRERGFLAGDEFIKDVASELQSTFPCSEIYRTSGDEFFILKQGVETQDTSDKLEAISSSEYGLSSTIVDKLTNIEDMFNLADGILVNKKNKRGEIERC